MAGINHSIKIIYDVKDQNQIKWSKAVVNCIIYSIKTIIVVVKANAIILSSNAWLIKMS